MPEKPQTGPKRKAGGYIRVQRGMFDHPIVGALKPYSRFEAWQWMLAAAAFRSTDGIERGSLAYSTRFMASAWGWSRPAVRRFLDRLEGAQMVGPRTGPRIRSDPAQLTICNYEQYQSDRPKDKSQTGPLTGPNKNTLNAKKKKLTTFADQFDAFWTLWPNKSGKKAAVKAWARLDTAGNVLYEDLVAGIERYIRDKPADREWMHPATFLNGERWKDEAPAPVQRDSGRKSMATIMQEITDDEGDEEGIGRAHRGPVLDAPKSIN